MISRTLHGAKLLCYINGKLVGLAAQISYTISTPHSAVHTIDTLIAAELIPSGTAIAGAFSLYRLVGSSMSTIGLTVPQSLISDQRYVTIQLVDRLTQETILRADACKTNSHSWTIPVKGLMTGQVTFTGITYSDEFDQ